MPRALRCALEGRHSQQPSLISHLRAEYDTAGEKLYHGPNVWLSLTGILTDMLKDPNLTGAVFVIDALDECTTNRSQLLDFIIKLSSASSRVKWIVSSRNWPEIEAQLGAMKQKVKLQLGLNQNSVSNAITKYIDYKVDQLGRSKNYSEDIRNAVQHYLTVNANGTFLWVALVCQELADLKVKTRHTLAKLKAFPPGLNSLYSRMLGNMNDTADAAICKQILAIVLAVYRPISFRELKILVESLEDFDQDELREITKSCGSFLALRKDVIYFVHQSAKDYLLAEAANDIIPTGISNQHRLVFLRSVKVLSRTLKRDIYGLEAPGYLADEVTLPEPDPLEPFRYSAVYWVDHLSDSKSVETSTDNDIEDGYIINSFIQEKYLYWLESLSLLRCVSVGVTALQKLQDIAPSKTSHQLAELLQDARRFILSHQLTIQVAPLQLYASAILFSPANSLIRVLFKKEEPDWVKLKRPARTDWGWCLQTLEGHNTWVNSVAFSHDSQLLASGSSDTIRIWFTDTGECRQKLSGHIGSVSSVVFSHDSTCLASCHRAAEAHPQLIGNERECGGQVDQWSR